LNAQIKVAFLLDSFVIAGGVSVIIEHCHALDGFNFEPFIVTQDCVSERGWHPAVKSLRVINFAQARCIEFDVAIATWWKTCYELHKIRSRHYAYFVQSVESRFYQSPTEDFEKPLVTATYHLPVTFVTEARWIRDYIRRLRPGASIFYVRNGIDKQIFNLGKSAELEPSNGPLRILIEGPLGVWFHGTTKAIEIASALPFPKRITLVTASDVPDEIRHRVESVFTKVPVTQMAEIYRNTDVLLKLSNVEGMFMPPLEAFHCGATAICSWVTGCDEYVQHGWNGFLTAPGDYDSIRRYFVLIDRDRRLLNFLRFNALATGVSWPSWQQSSRFMAAILEKIARRQSSADMEAGLLIPALFRKSIDASERAAEVAELRAVLAQRAAELAELRAILAQRAAELAELRAFREIILSSGSYRLARKMTNLRQTWPIETLRRIAPARIKHFLKHRAIR
jgi:glycosyltransferase involved in cell wall biosynthesis